MADEVEAAHEAVSNVSSTYMARVSLEEALQAGQRAEATKKFSALVSVVIPLTCITSAFSMNVRFPLAGYTDYWGFGIIMVTMFVIATISLIMFKRWKWY